MKFMEMNKVNILFLVNPISGVGKQKLIETNVEKFINHSKFSFKIEYTQYAKHASEIAKHAIGKFEIIVAVGGDGSVNEIVKSIYNTDVVLAIIPTGSGNGLARHLRIPLNIKNAIRRINEFNVKEIDVLKINSEISVNVSGLGFDGYISNLFAKSKNRGFLTYLKFVVTKFISYKLNDYEIEVDENRFTKNAFLISIANSSQFGNNIEISPNSIIDDGFYEIVIIKNFPKLISVFLGFKLIRKKIQKSKYVEIYKTNKKTIIRSSKNYAHIDGEAIYFENDIEIEIFAKALKVIC